MDISPKVATQREPEPIDIRIPERRRLHADQFETLFGALQHQELSDILRRQPELRQTGTKDTRIRTLWEAQLSEETLLSELTNRQLEEILQRLGLRISGTKNARMDRIVTHFEQALPATAMIATGYKGYSQSLQSPPDNMPIQKSWPIKLHFDRRLPILRPRYNLGSTSSCMQAD